MVWGATGTPSHAPLESNHFRNWSRLRKLNGHIPCVTGSLLLDTNRMHHLPSRRQAREFMADRVLRRGGSFSPFPKPTRRTLTGKRQNRGRRGQGREKEDRSLPAAEASGGRLRSPRTANATGLKKEAIRARDQDSQELSFGHSEKG